LLKNKIGTEINMTAAASGLSGYLVSGAGGIKKYVVNFKNKVVEKTAALKVKIGEYWKATMADSIQRFCSQLKPKDFIKLGIFTVASGGVMTTSFVFFGIAVLPVSSIVSTGIIGVGFYQVHTRIDRVYREKACQLLEEIKTSINDVTDHTKLKELKEKKIDLLTSEEYAYLRENESLKDSFKKFNKDLDGINPRRIRSSSQNRPKDILYDTIEYLQKQLIPDCDISARPKPEDEDGLSALFDEKRNNAVDDSKSNNPKVQPQANSKISFKVDRV